MLPGLNKVTHLFCYKVEVYKLLFSIEIALNIFCSFKPSTNLNFERNS